VAAGRVVGRRSDEDITLFKSLGVAPEDLAAAHYVLAAARCRASARSCICERGMSDAVRLPTAAEVATARGNIAGVARRTPLWRLDAETPAGVTVWLKLENLQPLARSRSARPSTR